MMLAAAVLVATGLLTLALYLGAWAYGYRSASLHERRLAKVVGQKATEEQVTAALQAEGMRLVGTAKAPEDLRDLARRWGGEKELEILERGKSSGRTLVFASEGLVYFLYFGRNGKLAAYTYLIG